MTMISKIKLNPIKDINKALATLVGLIPFKMSIKKIKQKTAKTPVLIIGIKIETNMVPNVSFFSLNGFIKNPAAIPAKVVFKIQVKIVPIGLTEKKNDIVLGENRVKTPDTNPKNPPTTGPYNIAPKAIIIKEKLRLANPPGIMM